MKKQLLIVALIFLSVSVFGQMGSWSQVTFKTWFGDSNWGVFGEAQVRSLEFYDQFHYWEAKGGVNYKVHPNFTFSLAAGKYNTYDITERGNFNTPMLNDEIRVWTQLLFKTPVYNFIVEHRYRVEARFTSYGYRNRFRYRLGVLYPVGKFTPFIYNALFFSDNEPYFERDRFYFGTKYKINDTHSLMLGYLYQFDYKIYDELGTQFMMVGYYLNL
jgi:hypothetical protein